MPRTLGPDDLRDTYRTDHPPTRLGCLLLLGAAVVSAGIVALVTAR